MDPRSRQRWSALAVALFALAVTGVLLLLFQPWVTCPDDTMAAACPMPESEAGWRLVASVGLVLAAVAGAVLVRWVGGPTGGERSGARRDRAADASTDGRA